MRISLPSNYPSGNCYLVAIDASLVPLVADALKHFVEARTWVRGDIQAGIRAFEGIYATMTALCSQQLVQEIRDLRGVMPAYASVPVDERTSDMYNDLNTTMAQITDLRGIQDDGWFSDTLGTLAQITQSMRGNTQSTGFDLWSTVRDLLIEGSSISNIVNVIAGFLETQEETAVEGGLLMALVAIESANVAAISQLALSNTIAAGKLDSIISALRGATAPDDNILLALRGTTDADEARNIVELLA